MESKPTKNPKFILFIVMMSILAFLTYVFKEIALLFFGSYVIACAINPIVDWMSKYLPRAVAISLIYILGLISFIIITIPLCAIVIDEMTLLLDNLPVYLAFIKKVVLYIVRLDIPAKNILFNFNMITQTMTHFATEVLNQSLNLTKSIIEGVTIAFTTAIIVLYMLLDKPVLRNGVLSFFPEDIRGKVHNMATNISHKIGGYVIGQIIMMLAVGVVTGIGLFFCKIKYAALLGLIAGLFDIVPIVGPMLAFMLAIIVAAPLGLKAVIATTFVYIFAQWSTNQFLKPFLFGKLLDLHPIVIILALLVAAQTLGVVGVILSPAIAATICVIFQEFYLKVINKNGDE